MTFDQRHLSATLLIHSRRSIIVVSTDKLTEYLPLVVDPFYFATEAPATHRVDLEAGEGDDS